MTAPQQLRCAGCNHRFGKRARSVLLYATYVLCLDCANSIETHRRIWFGCPHAHTAIDHGGDLVTIGIARQFIESANK